jgi:hypothetical protein
MSRRPLLGGGFCVAVIISVVVFGSREIERGRCIAAQPATEPLIPWPGASAGRPDTGPATQPIKPLTTRPATRPAAPWNARPATRPTEPQFPPGTRKFEFNGLPFYVIPLGAMGCRW